MQLLERIGAWFGAAAGSTGRHRPLDPRSVPVYAILVAALTVELAAIGFSDFYFGRSALVTRFPILFGALASAMLARRHGWARIALAIEAIVLPLIAGALAVTGTVLLAAVSLPFADAALDAADAMLGFDFPALIGYYREHQTIGWLSVRFYSSFAVQIALLPILVAVAQPPRRLWILLNAWCLTLVVAVLAFPFAPAAGPYVFHGIEEDVFDSLQHLFPWKTGPAIAALQSGAMRDIGMAARGFVSIPSVHAAGGLIFAWAAWHWRWVRWPLLVLNLGLIASTVVTGAHYLIDVIVGLALGALAIVVARRLVERLEPRPDGVVGGLAPMP